MSERKVSSIADILRKHFGAKPQGFSDTREIFNGKLCAQCTKPVDIKVYFGKRAHPYCKACHASYMREWRKENSLSPEARRKDNCRSYAGVYLRRGKITREPCKSCGSQESQMHHPDYAKPLLIEWLCRRCHMAEHYG